MMISIMFGNVDKSVTKSLKPRCVSLEMNNEHFLLIRKVHLDYPGIYFEFSREYSQTVPFCFLFLHVSVVTLMEKGHINKL